MVACSVLGPQEELLWKAPDGNFPSEDKTEAVVFTAFFERGFGIPTDAFFRGLLYYYGIEVTHLNQNFILAIAFFIHLCEAFIGITPHFDLWWQLYHLVPYLNKSKPNVVGGASLQLWSGMQAEYFTIGAKDSNKGWAEEWFFIENHPTVLPPKTR